MPHGITQDQVDQAADALLQAGERPTVEKVRAQLGTGSPNTVTRMLDAWRLRLAERLRPANALPSLPEDIGQAMTALWDQAVQHARGHAQQEMAAEREALQHTRSSLDARAADQAALLAATQAATQRAEEAARRAAVETTALRRLIERLEAEAKEHGAERTRLLAQNAALEAACTQLRDGARAIETKTAKERTARDEHVKMIEDRAHAEVDRARTELKAARGELAGDRKQHQAETQALQRTVAEVTRSLGAAEREAAHQRGVAEALKLNLAAIRSAKARSPRKRVSAADRSRQIQQKSLRKRR